MSDKISELNSMLSGVNDYTIRGRLTSRGKTFALRRPDNYRFGPIKELPGGKKRANETAYQTLSREIYEESGLKISGIKEVLGQEDIFVDGRRIPVVIVDVKFNFPLNKKYLDDKVKLSDEHSEYALIKNKNAARYNMRELHKKYVVMSSRSDPLHNVA